MGLTVVASSCGGTATSEGNRAAVAVPTTAAGAAAVEAVEDLTEESSDGGTEAQRADGTLRDPGGTEATRGDRALPDPDGAGTESAPTVGTGASSDVTPLTERGTILSESVSGLARQWDSLNREIYEADPSRFVRVAAETEQFSIVLAANRDGVFVAELTDTALLGGSVNGDAQVMEMVTVADADSDRDGAVALTSLRYAIDASDRTRDIAREYSEVAEGAPGDQETFIEGDRVVVVELLSAPHGLVSIAFARGVDPQSFELRAPGLVAAVVAAAGR